MRPKRFPVQKKTLLWHIFVLGITFLLFEKVEAKIEKDVGKARTKRSCSLMGALGMLGGALGYLMPRYSKDEGNENEEGNLRSNSSNDSEIQLSPIEPESIPESSPVSSMISEDGPEHSENIGGLEKDKNLTEETLPSMTNDTFDQRLSWKPLQMKAAPSDHSSISMGFDNTKDEAEETISSSSTEKPKLNDSDSKMLRKITNFLSLSKKEKEKNGTVENGPSVNITSHEIRTDPNYVKFYWYEYDEKTESGVDKEVLFNRTFLSFANGVLELLKGPVTYVVVDGFLTDPTSYASINLRLGLKRVCGNCDVFLMDWSQLNANSALFTLTTVLSNYKQAQLNIKVAAKRLADFLYLLISQNSLDPSLVHLIGFSLGAHLSGTTGKILKGLYKIKLGHITGLDPAGFMYTKITRFFTRAPKLYKTDADFVDIYHSTSYLLGDTEVSRGHVDVFLNGGAWQPGCTTDDFAGPTELCSHRFAVKFYISSMFTEYTACPCYKKYCLCKMCQYLRSCNDSRSVGFLSELKPRGNLRLMTDDPDIPWLQDRDLGTPTEVAILQVWEAFTSLG